MKLLQRFAAALLLGLLFAFVIEVPFAHAVATTPTRNTFDGEIHNNSLALSPDESTAVVSYSERPEVIVYDLKSNAVRGVVSRYITPRNIGFFPDGRSFFVSDSTQGVIERVDLATLKALSRLAAGPGVFGTVLSKSGDTLYANNQATSSVTVFDTSSAQARAVIVGFAQPRQGVKLSPDGKTLYVTNFLGDKVTIVDTKFNKIVGEITGFNKIRAISISDDGRTMFAANSGSDTIAVVDIEKRDIVTTVRVGKDPYGAALTPDGKFIYSGNLADNTVSVIDVPSLKVVATINGFNEPRQAIIFTRDGRYAYVLNADLSLSKVDLSLNQIVGEIKPPK